MVKTLQLSYIFPVLALFLLNCNIIDPQCDPLDFTCSPQGLYLLLESLPDDVMVAYAHSPFVYVSKDGGNTFTGRDISSLSPPAAGWDDERINGIEIIDQNLLLITLNDNVTNAHELYRSVDGGMTWSDTGYFSNYPFQPRPAFGSRKDGTVLRYHPDRFHYSTDAGATWVDSGPPTGSATLDRFIHTTDSTFQVIVSNPGAANDPVIEETTDGTSFTTLLTAPAGGETISDFVVKGSTGIAVGFGNDNFYYTLDSANTWNATTGGVLPAGQNCRGVAQTESQFVICCDGSAIATDQVFYTAPVTDIFSWTLAGQTPVSDTSVSSAIDIDYAGGVYFYRENTTGSGTAIWKSEDLTNWSLIFEEASTPQGIHKPMVYKTFPPGTF